MVKVNISLNIEQKYYRIKKYIKIDKKIIDINKFVIILGIRH